MSVVAAFAVEGCADSDAPTGVLPAAQAGIGAAGMSSPPFGAGASGRGIVSAGTTAAGSSVAGTSAGSSMAGAIAGSGGTAPVDRPRAGSGAGPAAGGGATAAAGSGGSAAPDEPCTDTCPVQAGVPLACKLRFMYGLNYAWHTFAADFGGNSAWNQPGVSREPAVDTELAAMAAAGVNVLRWWLWPDFRGDGVTFDPSDTPVGLGGTAVADVERALELAEKHDIHLMLTIFSFDNFRPTRMESTLRIRGIKPIAVDAIKRKALMDNVIAPLARTVAASPNAERMIAWDIINEPEWAITGPSMYGGDPVFDPQTDLETVTHAEMETLLRDTLQTLRANSQAMITVGATAFKWKSAWSMLDLDFHQFHMYDWVNMYWPYDRNPASYMLDDKPVVMGEFPLTGLMGAPYPKLLESWFGNAYAGALGWAYTDPMFSGNQNLTEVKAFASAHACETRY